MLYKYYKLNKIIKNMTTSNFSEILTRCRSVNDTIRVEAEKQVDEMSTNDFAGLLTNCAAELIDESKIKENRMLCATLIKNMLLHQEKHRGKWEGLPKEFRDNIKNYVLSCLASPTKEIRRACAITISGICKLEIPSKQWPEIVNILVSTANNENENYKISSIMTIGYISQELVPGQLDQNEIDSVLSALITNLTLDQSYEVIKHAIIALLNFIFFSKSDMENPNNKGVIMNTIYNCLNHSSEDIRELAMQCLVEISRLYYDYIESDMEKLLSLTQHFMLKKDKVAIQAFEFWCSVSDEEVSRLNHNNPCNGYCEYARSTLFNVISTVLLNRVASEEKLLEENEWTTVKAASVLLENLSLCTNDSLIDSVFSLIGSNISSDDPKIRDSVILAFGSILNTRHLTKIKDMILLSIQTLCNMLEQDKDSEVKVTVSWCIKKISELHYDTFINNIELFDHLMNAIIKNLKGNKKVIIHLCDAVHFFAYQLGAGLSEQTAPISKHIHNLLTNLLQTAYTSGAYDPNNNVAVAAFFAIGTIIDYSPLDGYPIINEFFSHVYNAFESTLDPKNFHNDDMRLAYQGYLASIISACGMNKVKMNYELGNAVYILIKQSFVQRQQVYEEGLMACSSIALTLGRDFLPLVADYGSYLVVGLNSWQDASLCRISINCTSDLIRALETDMSDYTMELANIILPILEVRIIIFIVYKYRIVAQINT